MINYIRSLVNEAMEQQELNKPRTNEIDNAAILEYASLFQELDDLTETGAQTSRFGGTGVSIPLEDDIEIDSIEMNLKDGRITDIPSDATVQEQLEAIGQKYVTTKTRDDFIEEGYHAISRRPRESVEKYRERVYEYAREKWHEYDTRMYQEGMFGYGKLEVNDLSVPDKIHLDFGPTTAKNSSSNHYAVTLPIRWQVDRKHRVTKKQIDSVQVWSKFGSKALMKMTDDIFKHVCTKYHVSGSSEKWNVLTPVEVIVPIDPSDEYVIAIGFDTDFSKETIYYTFSIPIKALTTKSTNNIAVPDGTMGRTAPINVMGFTAIRKRDFKLEQAELRRPKRWGGYYQEAIDFGGGGDEGGGDNPPTDASTDTPPTEDAGAEAPSANAVGANVNDVSDQIAQNVNNITAQQNAEDNAGGEDTEVDVTTDDSEGGEDVDINIDDTGDTNEGEVSDEDIDANIAALDGEGEEDMDGEADNAPSDLDDMTIDELVQQGAEKLKGMTLNQLKAFVASPDGTTPEEVSQEAYVTESKKSKSSHQTRFSNCCDTVIRRLEYIKKGIEGGWTDRDIMKCFFGAQTGYGSTISGTLNFGAFGILTFRSMLTGSVSENYGSDFFGRDMQQLAKFIRISGKAGGFTKEQKSVIKEYVKTVKSYINTVSKLPKQMASVKEILSGTNTLIEKTKELQKFVPDTVTSESDIYSVGDEQLMMENFFSDASNIKKRIFTAMNDVIPGLNKLYQNTESGDWDRYMIRKFWASVPYEPDPDSFEMSEPVFKGDQFRSYVDSLGHYLKVADAKRAKSAFTESDLSAIKECKDNLSALSTMLNKSTSKLRIRNDIDISEVAEKTRVTLESCLRVRQIVTTDDFAECYIQEAVFITKKNINKEMGVHIKSSLGILNDNTSDLQKLIKDFKSESKHLNRVLTRAAKMNDVYSKDEIAEITKLNGILTELSSNIRMNNMSEQYTERVKGLIKSYVKQCKVVSEIMDLKTGKRKDVQESCQACAAAPTAPVVAKEDAAEPTTSTEPGPQPPEPGESPAPAEVGETDSTPADTSGSTDVSATTECDKPKRFR